MKIEDTKAPDFKLNDSKGKEIKLSDFLGKSVVLYFYPKVCKICSQTICLAGREFGRRIYGIWLSDWA